MKCMAKEVWSTSQEPGWSSPTARTIASQHNNHKAYITQDQQPVKIKMVSQHSSNVLTENYRLEQWNWIHMLMMSRISVISRAFSASGPIPCKRQTEAKHVQHYLPVPMNISRQTGIVLVVVVSTPFRA